MATEGTNNKTGMGTGLGGTGMSGGPPPLEPCMNKAGDSAAEIDIYLGEEKDAMAEANASISNLGDAAAEATKKTEEEVPKKEEGEESTKKEDEKKD